MGPRVRLLAALVAGLLLFASPAIAHNARGIRMRQRVLSTTQNLDRSEANIGHKVSNLRFVAVRLECKILIEAQWFHPVTGETRPLSEDWFLRRKMPARSKARAGGTIFVEHPELTTDPQWQGQGVTVMTPHCHARSLG